MKLSDRCGHSRTWSTKKTTLLMYLTAFLIPVLIVTILYILKGVYPFGSSSFLRTDLYHQYAPFLEELKYRLEHGKSLLYTWNVGMGTNFTALFAYYLSCPTNFLSVLIPEDCLIEYMMVVTIVKIGLISMAMTRYFKYRNGGVPALALSVFGILFSLCGFMCAYYWSVIWLDTILLFPAVLYGAETLVQKHRILPYTAALALSILTNYYLSIMVCLFLVIYFVMLNILNKPCSRRELLLRCAQFLTGSLLAGGIAAVLVIPEYFALTLTISAESTFPKTWTQYFSLIAPLERMLPGVETEQRLASWPNVYSGCIVFLLFPIYLLAKKIPLREKAAYMENEFWRFEKNNYRTYNDGARLHMPTVPVFNSTANVSVNRFLRKLGCETSTNAYGLHGTTPLTNMLLGIKYSIYDREYTESDTRRLVASENSTYLYENRNSLSLGFMLPESFTNAAIFENDFPAGVQNALSSAITGKDVLKEDFGNCTVNGQRMIFTVSGDGEYYAFLNNSEIKSAEVTTPYRTITCSDTDRRYFIDLGELKKRRYREV